jgi:hypothetical protein
MTGTELGKSGPNHGDRAPKIGLHKQLKRLKIRYLLKFFPHTDPSGKEENVEPAELLDRGAHGAGTVILNRDIANHNSIGTRTPAADFAKPILPPGEEDNRGAVPRKLKS